MKLRCPYCKHSLGSEARSACPACGKTMMIPDRLRGEQHSERKRARELRERAARREHAVSSDDFLLNRSPGSLFIIIAVMTVLGVLLIGVTNRIYPTRAREAVAANELTALRIAVERFMCDCGRYPSEDEGLDALVLDPGISGWGGHYVNIIRPDPWFHNYCYIVTNGVVTLFSMGPDGIRSADDIIAAEPTPDEVVRSHDIGR